MKNLLLPPMSPRRLAFYLAMEEWAAAALPAGDYFFAWRVAPTVICGRNQDIEREVDLNYCRNNGIDVVRRKSGGGTVYADMDNYMFSYITPGDEVSVTFSRYTGMIASMLCSLGIEAKATGRNDIVIGAGKVAGNAFYHKPGRCIAHGTMLYDFDPTRMMRAITSSRAKLESKAVTSAPMRVTCLRTAGLGLSLEDFGAYAIDYLCKEDPILLSAADIEQISALEQEYYKPDYFAGRRFSAEVRKPDIVRSKRIEGVGEFEVAINLNRDNEISGLGIWGDFFVNGDISTDIIEPLTGIRYEAHALESAICRINPESVISSLSRNNLLTLLI